MGSQMKDPKLLQSINTDFINDYTPNMKFNSNFPLTSKAQLQKRETHFKILSPHSQAIKDYDDNVGSAIKHTTSQLSLVQGTPDPDSHLKYRLHKKDPNSRQILKVGGSSSQLFQLKEDKLLEKTMNQAKRFEHHDLYENIDMKNFSNVTPNKQSLLNNQGTSNFVNFKNFQSIDRRQKTVQFTLTTPSKVEMFQPQAKAMAKTLLFESSSYNETLPQKQDKNNNYPVFSSFNTIQNQSATPAFKNYQDLDISAKQQLIKRKLLTNNNYSSMLNAVAKKRKLDQLQVRFQQTVNMLPDEAKQHLMELASQLEQVQEIEEQQRLLEMQRKQNNLNNQRQFNSQEQPRRFQNSKERVLNQEVIPRQYQDFRGNTREDAQIFQGNSSQSYNMKIEEQLPEHRYDNRNGFQDVNLYQSRQMHPSEIKNYVQSEPANIAELHRPPTVMNVNKENPQEIAQKINILINQSQQQQQKLHDNLFNSILRIEEEKEQPNAGQKEFRVFKERKKISQYFSLLQNQQDILAEENLKTKNFNQATYYYQDEEDLDGIKKRKLDEQKLITDFVSERENFIIQQNRMKRIMGLAPSIQEYNQDPFKAKNASIETISLEEFLKHNKINPKIFSADTLQHQDVNHSTSQVKNMRPNTNKKHAAIQKIVLLIQTQKIPQAKQLVLKSLKEFPGDITLLFDKGLILLMNKEYLESSKIYESLKPLIQYKNSVLINLFLSYLRQDRFEDILELKDDIQKSETFMDYDEKNLKKMVLFAKEKLQFVDYDRYQAFISRQKLKAQGYATQVNGEQAAYPQNEKKKSLPVQQENQFEDFPVKIDDTLDIEITQYNKRHNRQWSYSKDHVHRDSLFSHTKKTIELFDKRKSSADTERSLKQKQGQALYIIKKSQQILNEKNQQMKQKYDHLQELYSETKSAKSGGEKSSKKSENIFKSMTDDQILDKINKRKLKQLMKSTEKYKDAMDTLKEQQDRTNMLIKQSTMKLKRKTTSKSIGRNSSEGRNQPVLMHKDSDLSVEFKEAYGRLEAEMQTSKEYFFKKLRNITSKQEDLGPQFDPVQMEYDLLIQEIENLKKEIGGEDKLYEYIKRLQNEKRNRSLSNSRQTSSRERPWVEQTKEKEQDMLFQLKMKQYSRAISVLLDTKNSLFFYNGNNGGSGSNQNLKSSQLSGSKSKQISSRQLSKEQSLSKISQRLDRTQSKFQGNQSTTKPLHSNTLGPPQRQGTIFKKFNTQQEVEESFKNIEARLNVYEQAEKKNETDDQAMMRILAISEDQLEERKNLQKGITGHILMPQSERREIQNQRQQDFLQFDAKTQEFLDYLFETYGLQQMIVADTQALSLFKEIQNEVALNQYINQMSMFVTNRSSDLQHLHKYSKPKDQQKEKINEANFIDIQDHAEIGGTEASEIESFQKLLELKIIEKIADKQEDESEFYAAMLQKLNTIDILQAYLKKCAISIKNGEDHQVVKKEITFAMLQIFREQISKKELHERQRRNGIVGSMDYDDTDYDLLDKIVRRLKFFRTFDQRVRHKLYRICRYQILPPDKLIMRKEEIDEMIIVIINGTASLMVQDNQQQLTYSVSTLFPGESLGDVNLTNTLKHKDDQCQTFVKSDKECDILVFDKRQFANVLFQEMKDSLYEKIITLKNSEFFESISPYALVILCSNIEIKEYTYGDVIVRQQNEPEYCFIIVSGECKVAYETIVYKTRDEIQSTDNLNNKQMHFGFQKYKPSDDYVGFKKNQVEKTHEREDKFKYQQKLNEKFSFQNDRIDVATLKKDQQSALQTGTGGGFHSKTGSMAKSQIGGGDGGILSGFTKGAIQKEAESKQLIAFRHHIHYDKLVQGKCFCARTLLEKDYIKKFIEREFDEFKQQLGSDFDFIKRGVSGGVQSSVKQSNSLHTREFTLYQQRQGAQSKESLMGMQPSKVSKFNNAQVLVPNTDFDPYQQKRYKQMLEGQNDLSQYDPKKNDSPRLETDPLLANGNKDKTDFYKKLNQLSKKSLQSSTSKAALVQPDINRLRSNGEEDMFAEGGLADKLLLGDNLKNAHENSFSTKQRETEIKFIYDQLMKSQLTVIADSASVKVIVISRKSKKYLSEPLKAVIDNKILNLKFKDYDRPFKNQAEISKFLENQKNWESFKNKLSTTNNQNPQQGRLNL